MKQPFVANEIPSAYSMPVDQVLKHFELNVQNGLDENRVASVRQRYGANQLVEAVPVPIWQKLLAQFRELVIWILIIAAIIAGVMGEWIDTIAILAIVVLNGILGFIQEEKAGRALAALQAMSAPVARVRRNGTIGQVPARDLVPGDIVQLEAGDNVPADARLIESFGVSAQEASLTGESVSVGKDAASVLLPETPLPDRNNTVFMGTVIASGKALAVVTATGMRTEIGRIAGMLRQSDSELTPLQRRLGELGRILVVVCLGLVSLIFAIQFLRGGELVETLLVAVSLAVAAVPEGLPAVVTIALALGLQRMVKRNVLIRRLPSVETLGSVTVICSDKTGTLTRNEMTVRELWTGDGQYLVTGAGYEPHGEFQTRNSRHVFAPHESTDLMKAITIGAFCNSASVVPAQPGQPWQVIGDPTEGALIVMALKAGIDPAATPRQVQLEIPFDSERKAMSVILRESNKTVMFTKGAPEVILDKCSKELCGGQVVELGADRKQVIQRQNSDMASRALRVLAFAYRDEPVEIAGQFQETELVFAGVAGMIDPPRDEVKAAVQECRIAGIRPVMITGDHPETALAIGCELGIATSESRTITGKELDDISDEQLAEQVDQIAIYARVSAAHKLRVVKAWKKRGQVVAMTGDGVNDAPAIKAADIGIAMGITGTDVTREASDMVLSDDNFTSIVSAIREGRGIFDNIRKFVHYLLSCNAGEVMLMFAAAILGLPLPLLAIQILWINLVTDGFPALALALEPPERDIMQRQPRPPREPVISWQQGGLIIYHGSLICLSALVGYWWVLNDDPANLDMARSVAFAITAFSQLAFAMVCRSQRYTLPRLGLFSNYWLFVAFAVSGLLQLGVLTLPFARDVFDVVLIAPNLWLWVIALSLVPATVIELAKIARVLFCKFRLDRLPEPF